MLDAFIVTLISVALVAEIVVAIKLRDRYITWLPFVMGGILGLFILLLSMSIEPPTPFWTQFFGTIGTAVIGTASYTAWDPRILRRKRKDIKQ